MNPIVRLETSMGVIEIELYAAKSPITSENFLRYVQSGFYNGLIFHRVIKDFMIQGGGFTPQMVEKPTPLPPIKNEARTSGIRNTRGTISMARTNDPHSATSQFFINLKDNAFLDPNPQNPWGYAAFGRVVKGMDVVDRIALVPTHRVGIHDDVPMQPVVINRAYVVSM